MVEHGALIEVSVGGIGVGTVEELCEFKHVVGVARFWSVDVVYIVYACFLGGEMLTSAVSADGE